MTTNDIIILILATLSASMMCLGTYLAHSNPQLSGSILGYTIIISIIVLPTAAILLHNNKDKL